MSEPEPEIKISELTIDDFICSEDKRQFNKWLKIKLNEARREAQERFNTLIDDVKLLISEVKSHYKCPNPISEQCTCWIDGRIELVENDLRVVEGEKPK